MCTLIWLYIPVSIVFTFIHLESESLHQKLIQFLSKGIFSHIFTYFFPWCCLDCLPAPCWGIPSLVSIYRSLHRSRFKIAFVTFPCSEWTAASTRTFIQLDYNKFFLLLMSSSKLHTFHLDCLIISRSPDRSRANIASG
jgi:hypothetical protein